MSRVRFLAVGAAVLALAGCSADQTGQPKPETSSTAGTAAPTTTTSKFDAPPPVRPKVIKLDGVDPCAALTAAQLKQLKVATPVSKPLDVAKTGNPAPTCTSSSTGSQIFSYSVSLVVDRGVDLWQGSGNLDVSPAQVSGFSAFQIKLKGTSKGDCVVTVDVADGQQVFVQFLPIGDGFTQDQMCQNAKQGAEMALATLQTLK
ncbi:DUF3558 domain-containing protein [Umezawaea endophytica]|uniref:DUF3558 domain-containing protein n=1 Tax=Umezawaea endophytica TaxID=1654476 RepID=A0A9X2VR72_9PSEU|nr:DUF3558 domain-containing protein [Umezawaea endophytica]MCS7480852.1 DUF3558 domain-containing protein [Umezawaea endophytica]